MLIDSTEFIYKCIDYYNPKAEHSLIWNNEPVGIEWDLAGMPNPSPKDLLGKRLSQIVYYYIIKVPFK